MYVKATEERKVKVRVNPYDALVSIGSELGIDIGNVFIKDGIAYADKGSRYRYDMGDVYVVSDDADKVATIKALLTIKKALTK